MLIVRASNLKQIQRFRLLFLGGSIGLTMLLTYLFGLVLGLGLFLSAYIGFIVYTRKRESNTLNSLGLSNSNSDTATNKGQHANNNISGGSKIMYICLSCGRKVSGRTCRKCGSRMKKAVF